MTYDRGQLALKILFIIAAGTLIPASILAPNLAQVTIPLLKKLAKQLQTSPYKVRRSLASIKRNRLVGIRQHKGELQFILLERGRQRIVKGNFDTLTIAAPKKWDRKWRVVLFDVPEQRKKAREALRVKLKDLGLYPLQKSCFVHPYECKGEIDFVSEFFNISPHVHYHTAESMESEGDLRHYFNL